MKTLYISTLAIILLSINAHAQPSFSMNDIGFQVGDIIEMDSVGYVDVSGMTGPSMIWDLNDLTFGNTILATEILPIEDVVSPVTFDGANRVRKFTMDDLEFYQYYTVNDNDIQFNGYFSEFGGNVISSVFENTQLIFNTPMTYGSTGMDTYNSVTSSLGSEGELNGESSYEIVGYGTLLLNGETHNNVLLMNLMSEETTINTFGGVELETVRTDDAYLFFKAGYHFPLLTFSHTITDSGIFGMEEDFSGNILLQQSFVGVYEESKTEFKLYPNPTANDEITVHFSEPISTNFVIKLIDPLGKTYEIAGSSVILDENTIQVMLPRDLSHGMYQMLITGGNIFSSKPIVIE